MLAASIFIAAFAGVVAADPLIYTPAQGQVGGECSFTWSADPTGVWKKMYIEFMAGPNDPMQRLTTLGSVDATDPTVTSFNFTCPSVSPPAPIYFLQISSPYTKNITWTTRFAIADVNGQTVPAPTPTQPPGQYGSAGQPTPWGSATLTGPTSPAPADVGASASASPSSVPANGASPGSTSASNALTNSASATPGMTSGSNSSTGTPTVGSAAPSGTGHNGAAGVGAVSFLTLGTVAMFIALVI